MEVKLQNHKNVTELQTNDFEYMSKKLILDNLNKVFIVDENNIIQAIGSINDFIRIRLL